MKTEQEICKIINDYEKNNPSICGTDTLIKFIQWYECKILKEQAKEILFWELANLEHQLPSNDILIKNFKEYMQKYI